MFQRILVPLDGSERSERAIPVAARIARAQSGTIIFINVILPPVEFGTYSAERTVELKPGAFHHREEAASNYLKSITSTYANELAGINTETDLSSGAAAPEIYSAALLEKVDLIVLCSHGEAGLKRWAFRSIAQEGVRHSPVPVLVLKEGEETSGMVNATHPLRILVPVDGSALSETALVPTTQFIQSLALPSQSEIHLFHVIDTPLVYGKMKHQAHIADGIQEDIRGQAERYMQSLISWCQTAFAGINLRVTSSLAVNTDVVGTITRIAEQSNDTDGAANYDMIAMATHGRGGLKRLLMGSVTEHTLKDTNLPLLVVRPPKVHVEEDVSDEADSQTTENKSQVGLL